MLIKERYHLIKYYITFFLFLMFLTSKGQLAKKELEEAFNHKNTSLDELIYTLTKYIEIETSYIVQNEGLILGKLSNSNSYSHKVDVYNLLANAYWYRNKREKYDFYSSKVDSILAKHSNYKIGVANHLRLKGLYSNDINQSDLDKSLSLLDSALYVSEQTENIYLIAKSYYSLAYVYWDNSMFQEALLHFKESEELFLKTEAHYALARIYMYYSIHNKNIGDLATSLDYCFKIEKLYQNLNEEKSRADILGRIGNIYLEMGNYDDALKILNASLSKFQSLNAEKNLPYAYERIGSLYLKMGNYSKAEEYFLKSIELGSKVGNKIRLNGLKTNMIDIFIHKNEYDNAIKILNETLELYTKLKFIPGQAKVYERYAEVFYLQNKYQEAIENTKTAIKLAQEVNNISILKDSYYQLSKYYEIIDEDNLALKNYKLFKNYSDTLFNEEKLLKVENLKTKYEIKQKEQEIEQLEANAEIKNQQFQLTILISILLILLTIILFVFKRSRDKSRHLKILEDKNKELQELSKKLEISNNFKNRLIANISHEVRTPLNVIIGFTSALDDSTEPHDFKQAIDEIQRSSDNLTRTVDSMLDISLLESDQIRFKKEYFDSLDLKNNIEELIKQEFWKRNRSLEYQIECPQNFKIFSDKIRIKQILRNIIENSVKYTEKGKLDISITNFNGSFCITIKDTGVGIEKDKLNQIFERFYKVEDTKKLYRGAGLGLSISYELVKMLNGNIVADSELKKGTTFTITLPLN